MLTVTAVVSLTALAACTGGGSGLIEPSHANVVNFVTPAADGSFPRLGRQMFGASSTTASGDRISWNFDANTDETGVAGQVGVIIDGALTATPTSGTATYRGLLDIGIMEGINSDGHVRADHHRIYSSQIDMVADFGRRSLSYDGELVSQIRPNPSFDLEISGRIDRNTLTGTVVLDGVEGVIQGEIGGNRAVAALHGASETMAYGGGFSLVARP